MAIQMGKDVDVAADAAAGSSATPGTPAPPSRPGSPSLEVSAPHHPHDRSDDRFDEVGGLVARLSTHFEGDEEWIEVEVTDGAEQWTVDVHWRKASTNMMGVRRLVVVKGHRVMVTEGLSSFFEPDEPARETSSEPPPDRPLPADFHSPGTFLERLRRRAIGRDWWRVRDWMLEQLRTSHEFKPLMTTRALSPEDRRCLVPEGHKWLVSLLATRAQAVFASHGTPIRHAYRMAAQLVLEEREATRGQAAQADPAPDLAPAPEPPTTIDHVLRTHRGELTVSVRFDPLRRDGHPAFTAYPADRDGRGDGHSVVEALGRLAAHLVNEAHANLGALKGEERTR